MPHTKSAKKHLRQSIAICATNRSAKRSLHTQYKKVVEAVEAGDTEKAEAELRAAAKKVDQAAAKKIIHRNAASRTKARLAAKVKKLKGK
jgi:small subunit ribosomal protein S20